MPPIYDPGKFTSRILLPQFRSGVSGTKIVSQENLPAIAKAVEPLVQEPNVQKTVKASRVRIQYTHNRQVRDEDFYMVLVYSRVSVMPNMTLWNTERLYSFQAPAGKLDSYVPVLHSMISSFRLSPEWFSAFSQVQAMWIQNQMQSIRNAGALSRYISGVNNEISAMNWQAYENRQASLNRINSNFSRYIRGVEEYHNPFANHPIELPSGYRHAWANASGEYILSDQSGFNPNIGSTTEWKPLDKSGGTPAP
jgi:hypothetical protein